MDQILPAIGFDLAQQMFLMKNKIKSNKKYNKSLFVLFLCIKMLFEYTGVLIINHISSLEHCWPGDT